MPLKYLLLGENYRMQIQGDGLDALIFSYLLFEEGMNITLTSDLEKMGGHFKGIKHNDSWLDFGMVALESNSRGLSTKPLTDYSMQTGRELLPFLPEAFGIFESKISPIQEIPVAARLRNSELIPDYFISDHLGILRILPIDIQNQILSELDVILPWLQLHRNEHPFNKYDSPYFHDTSLIQALHQTIGVTATKELFSDFIEALLGSNMNELSAANHRRAWIPLYWPETFKEALVNVNSGVLDKSTFSVPVLATVAELVGQMKIKMLDKVSFKENQHSKFDPNTSQQSKVSFTHHVLLDDKSKYNTTRVGAPVSIVHYCVEDCPDSVIFWQKPRNFCYRSTVRKLKQGSVIALEFGFVSGRDDANLLVDAKEILELMGLVITCEGLVAHSRIPLSVFGSFEPASFHSSESITGSLAIDYLYPSSYNSFNDNLVRATHAYTLWKAKNG